MCYNAYHLSLALNAIFSFLIIICSTLLFSDQVLSKSLLVGLPIKADDDSDLSSFDIEFDGGQMLKNDGPRDYPTSSRCTPFFGPRLGRKKRSIEADDDFLDVVLADDRNKKNSAQDDLRLFRQAIILPLIIEGADNGWATVGGYPSQGQRVGAKRRLGRANLWSANAERMVKAPPFSPRLGRRSLMPLKPRLGRAGTSPETAIFKPRLGRGRDPNFNDLAENAAVADARNGVDDKDA